MKTMEPVPNEKIMGIPFSRLMFSGVTRSMLDGLLVVTSSILPTFMSHPSKISHRGITKKPVKTLIYSFVKVLMRP